MKLKTIGIENFKSIKELSLKLNKINILIGANGAGKSNFVQFFNLLNNIVSENLQNYIAKSGGADSFLYFGRKSTEAFSGKLSFGDNGYEFELTSTAENNFIFSKEIISYHYKAMYDEPWKQDLSSGNKETRLVNEAKNASRKKVANHILNSLDKWRVYHFHDTSSTAKVKHASDINDNRSLRRDASNLAAFLYRLQEKHVDHFTRIEDTIRLVAPFFEKFQLEPSALDENSIRLEWRHRASDEYFNANYLSDGTLRIICLITLLLQPNLPHTIIIDEPEIGLHPAAIELLASLIQSVALEGKQVICSTQSVTFLNQFSPEDIIVVDRVNEQSIFKRQDKSELTQWLNEYAVGELWEKNVLGGRP
ncbi:MAG: AAA family ATPase [Melioribacteraceae bacterium]|nr:AAA family ATPase [Melioribacteraceae bacterium]